MAVCKKCNSKYVPDMGYGPQDYCNFCAHRVVAKLNAENEKLKAELEAHRWIPVEERLPEGPGYYQVLRRDNRFPSTREFYPGEHGGPQWISKDVITHWKPITLPE